MTDTPLILTGRPRQRGLAHGEALRAQIHEGIGRWKQLLGQSNGKDPDEYLRGFLAARHFEPALQRWTPGLLEEIQGIGEGAGVDFETIYAWNLVDEEWVYQTESWLGPLDRPPEHCSSIAVYGEGRPPLVAQNMDLTGFYHGLQTILRIDDPDSDLQVLLLTVPGVAAITGLNNRGVGVCLNTLIHLNPSTDGLPVAAVLRGMLERGSAAEAARFAAGLRHASGQNYLIGDLVEVIDLECSARGAARFEPAPGATRVWHTNHPLASRDTGRYDSYVAALSHEDQAGMADFGKNTRDRLASVRRDLAALPAPVTPEGARAVLSSHDAPVCRHPAGPQQSCTFGCVVMELSDTPVFEVAPGAPCCTPVSRYTF